MLTPILSAKARTAPKKHGTILIALGLNTIENLWDIYLHGALRKSIDWAYQNEWRLLLPLGRNKETNYNIPFFPITKVYLGNRMNAEDRNKIIDICKERGIPYVGVKRSQDYFEMQDCEQLCENCLKVTNVKK